MNKIILFFLFPVLVFNTSVREVIKTPQLINHFFQHHQQNADLSFIEFLDMHYFGHDLNDHDDEEDMKLPFKKTDGHHVISIGVPAEKFVLLKISSFDLFNEAIAAYYYAICSPTVGSLFRPPIQLA